MSTSTSLHPVARRVRHQARDVALLMLFSALTSLALAGLLTLLAHLTAVG